MARGRWLLFLHADSRLPIGWWEAIAEAEAVPDIAAGAFRLALDSPAWRARLIELGVRLRVALFGLPYGDQALFVRRDVFLSLDGYRDLPLMEDIDLVRRLKKVGRLYYSRAVVVTSARRWEREGWVRRSALNVFLMLRFVLSGSAAALAQEYFHRRPGSVVIMARAPWTVGKTRLRLTADEHVHAALRCALFRDTLDVATSARHVDHIVACEPAGECERMQQFVPSPVDVIAQRGRDLGERLAHVFEDVFRLGAESIVVIGSDLPDLPPRIVQDAFAALRGRPRRVVLGPAADGGYYLIGMNRSNPTLFEQIDWGTAAVCAQTVAAAKAHDLDVVLLEEWADVDDVADLIRVVDAPHGASRTRAWGAQYRHALRELPLA